MRRSPLKRAVDDGPGFDPFALELTAPAPFMFMGRDGAIVRKNTYHGITVCWGEGSLTRYAPSSYYRPFGVFTPAPLTTPSPFPIPEADGGIPIPGGEICGYGTGLLYGPFGWIITANGYYYHVGDNTKGQAGNGFQNDNADPPDRTEYTYTTALPFAGSEIVHVSTGPAAVMILRSNGEVWGVGGTFYAGSNFHGFPQFTDLLAWKKIADYCVYCDCFDSGGAIVKGDGRIKFVGTGSSGRFGTGNENTFKEWQTIDPALWQAGGGFKKVRVQSLSAPASYGSALALRNDGTLWFAGNNQHRLCGDPDVDNATNLMEFQRVPNIPLLQDFDANDAAAYGLDYDGRLWAWGTQAHNIGTSGASALGDGGAVYEKPLPTVLISRIKQIYATYDHGYAVKGNDDVYSWGGPYFSNGGIGRLSGPGTLIPSWQGVPRPDIATAPIMTGGTVPTIRVTSDPQ